MRDALLQDLSSSGYVAHTTIDARLSAPEHCERCSTVNKQDDVWAQWEAAILSVDAVWIIAPETDGYLARVTALALASGKTVIGCDLTSIQIFSNKLHTTELLTQSNIASIPSYTWQNWPVDMATTWLAKPNDGAGCEETVVFDSAKQLQSWLRQVPQPTRYVIQPYISGDAASITCIVHKGRAHVLSCNTQEISLEDNRLRFDGCLVNGMKQHWPTFETLANQVARLFPNGMTAYIGIDVIVNPSNTMVVEINPRLTTSYVGLERATGHNPAALILQAMTQPNFIMPTIKKNVLEVSLNAQYV